MTESQQESELFLAVGTGDLSKVKSLVDFDVSLLADRYKGRGPMMAAIAFHLDSKSHRSEFERMLFEDIDREVRMVAAMALGCVLRESRDYRAARLLLKKLHDSGDDAYVRLAAYEALQDIWLPKAERRKERLRWLAWPMSELAPLMWGWDEELRRRVDWTFVESVQRQIEYSP